MNVYLRYFALICLLTQVQSETKFEQLGNQSEAEMMCHQNGGLASFEYFFGQTEEFTLESQDIENLGLLDNEAVWVSGFADFSSFVSWFGCFHLNESSGVKFTLKRDGNFLYECLKSCQKYRNNYHENANSTYDYIGFISNKCYCLNQPDSGEMWPDQLCEHKELEVNSGRRELSDIKSYWSVSVYQIFDGRINWKYLPAVHQCVYGIRSKDVEDPQFGTASCFSDFKFICEAAYHKLNETCGVFHRHNNLTQSRYSCFVNKTSTWIEAYHHCRDHLGKLFDILPREIWALTETSTPYWTGIFRTFKVQGKSRSENPMHISKSCLAVKRVGSRLLIDPDDCSSEKRFLCTDKIAGIIKRKNNNSADENLTISISIALGIAVFVAFTIAVFTLYKVKRQRCANKTKPRDNRNDKLCNEHITRCTQNCVSSEKRDINSEETSRFTNIEQYDVIGIEISPRCGVSDVSSSSGVSEEYDKINLKNTGKNYKDTNIMNTNIYNHTKEVDTYDELGGSKSIHFVKNSGIYNEMSV